MKPAGAHIHLHLVVPVEDARNDDELHGERGLGAVLRLGQAQQLLEGLLPDLLGAVGAQVPPRRQRLEALHLLVLGADGKQPGAPPFGVDAGRILKGKLLPQGWRQRFVKMAEVIPEVVQGGLFRGHTMIELKQVTKEYGRATVLKNITLTLEEPGIYCLLGRNGAGKTTLCRFMVDARFRQEGLEEKALEHILRG